MTYDVLLGRRSVRQNLFTPYQPDDCRNSRKPSSQQCHVVHFAVTIT